MPEPQGASRPAASFCQRMEKACLMQVVYEDNHIIIVNKQAGEIVQGDRTGDRTLADDVKAYIKERYAKPYWAITANRPQDDEGHLEQYLVRNPKNNKTYVAREGAKDAKLAVLDYRLIASSDRYNLLEVNLVTGRHHQIRCQLAAMGCPIKGDLKYGAPRSNPDGSISLLARRVRFEHPVSHIMIDITAPLPDDKLWRVLSLCVKGDGGE